MDGDQIRTKKQEIRARLVAIKEQVEGPPVARCGEQFYSLLMERIRLREILKQL